MTKRSHQKVLLALACLGSLILCILLAGTDAAKGSTEGDDEDGHVPVIGPARLGANVTIEDTKLVIRTTSDGPVEAAMILSPLGHEDQSYVKTFSLTGRTKTTTTLSLDTYESGVLRLSLYEQIGEDRRLLKLVSELLVLRPEAQAE